MPVVLIQGRSGNIADVNADKSLPVQLNGSNEQIKIVDASSSTTVAAGGLENVSIYAPAGKIYRLLGLELYVPAPSGATSDTHGFDVYLSSTVRLTNCRYAYNNYAQFAYSSWRGTPSTGYPIPSDVAAIVTALSRVEFSSSVPFLIQYINNTDQPQTSTRSIKLVVLERGGQ